MNQRKEELKKTAADELQKAGICFKLLNNGNHFRVSGSIGERYDFWPSTSKFMKTGTCHVVRGDVKDLIEIIKMSEAKAESVHLEKDLETMATEKRK